jgi:hypothetical protein
MIPKSGYRFSEKIMLKQIAWSGMTKVIPLRAAATPQRNIAAILPPSTVVTSPVVFSSSV